VGTSWYGTVGTSWYATVGTSWYGKVKEFKSPLHVVAAFLLRSREKQPAKVSQLSQRVAELQSPVEQQQQRLQQQHKEIDTLRQRIRSGSEQWKQRNNVI